MKKIAVLLAVVLALVVLAGCIATGYSSIDEHLKRHLMDPGSFRLIEKNVVEAVGMGSDIPGLLGGYYDSIVTITYRAKNSMGGYVIETRKFILKNRRILKVEEVE